MKLHVLTIGKPKLSFAKLGWDEYLGRLEHRNKVRVTQLSDKFAYDSAKIIESTADTYRVGLVIEGSQLSSHELADFLKERALESREVSFIIGGPDGLPQEVRQITDFSLSLSKLTFPHDLAMITLLEALYRADSINAGTPYHH